MYYGWISYRRSAKPAMFHYYCYCSVTLKATFLISYRRFYRGPELCYSFCVDFCKTLHHTATVA